MRSDTPSEQPVPPAGASAARPDPALAAPRYTDVVGGSRLDGGLSWYRAELRLRRVVGVLALPGLAALTAFGMIVAPGPVPWILAGLTFLAGAEIVSTSWQLHRRQESGDREVPPGF